VNSHLVVFNAVESLPLECLLLDIAQHSLHASISILWHLEYFLADLRPTLAASRGAARDSVALKFDRAGRVLQEVQMAVWGEMVRPQAVRRLSQEYARAAGDLDDDSLSTLADQVDTLPGLEATLVGFGCALAAFGSPRAAQAMRPLVLMEARKQDRLLPLTAASTRFRPLRPIIQHADNHTHQYAPASARVPVSVPMTGSFPSIEDLSQGRAFSLRDAIARTARQVKQKTHGNPTDIGGSTSMPALYYHPEMQFVMGLIDISQRLCHVTRGDGRQQALHAELSLLNHNLPAALCIPLWCRGTNSSHRDSGSSPSCGVFPCHGKGAQHQRLLRIPAGEAVILNSAERVPYVVYIEVARDMEEGAFAELMAAEEHKLGDFENQRPKPSPLSRESPSTTTESAPATPKAIKTPPTLRPRSSSSTQSQSNPVPNPKPQQQRSALTSPHPSSQSEQLQMLPVDGASFAERMRTAAIMLAQLTRQATSPAGCPPARLADINAIKAKLIGEMEGLEKSRLLDALHTRQNTNDDVKLEEQDPYTMDIDSTGTRPAKDDPSAAVFREPFEEKRARIRQASPYGRLPGWDLLSVIVKAGADMRQEQLACQLIEEMHDIWSMAGLPIWVCPFRILVAGQEGGLVETVRNALSIHSIRKAAYAQRSSMNATAGPQPLGNGEPFTYSLRDHYIRTFGSPDSDAFINARDAFMRSLAGYSLVTYVLQLRDRHNGNILIDSAGHMIHIDFGFMLANAPGGYYGFESAPFKLSAEYIDLLGGLNSESFHALSDLIHQGFLALRKHADRLLLLLEITHPDSSLPCFGSAGLHTLAQLKARFQLGLTEQQVRLFVERMITGSAYNVFTRLYDSFQYYSNGIL